MFNTHISTYIMEVDLSSVDSIHRSIEQYSSRMSCAGVFCSKCQFGSIEELPCILHHQTAKEYQLRWLLEDKNTPYWREIDGQD